jgi:hypothetical protein
MSNLRSFPGGKVQPTPPKRRWWNANCWLLHHWLPWKDIRNGQIIAKNGSTIVGHFVDQERRCIHCNLVEMKTIRT